MDTIYEDLVDSDVCLGFSPEESLETIVSGVIDTNLYWLKAFPCTTQEIAMRLFYAQGASNEANEELRLWIATYLWELGFESEVLESGVTAWVWHEERNYTGEA